MTRSLLQEAIIVAKGLAVRRHFGDDHPIVKELIERASKLPEAHTVGGPITERIRAQQAQVPTVDEQTKTIAGLQLTIIALRSQLDDARAGPVTTCAREGHDFGHSDTCRACIAARAAPSMPATPAAVVLSLRRCVAQVASMPDDHVTPRWFGLTAGECRAWLAAIDAPAPPYDTSTPVVGASIDITPPDAVAARDEPGRFVQVGGVSAVTFGPEPAPAPLPMWSPADRPCRKCRSGNVGVRVINDDHGDEEFKCGDCGHRWSVDGIDS